MKRPALQDTSSRCEWTWVKCRYRDQRQLSQLSHSRSSPLCRCSANGRCSAHDDRDTHANDAGYRHAGGPFGAVCTVREGGRAASGALRGRFPECEHPAGLRTRDAVVSSWCEAQSLREVVGVEMFPVAALIEPLAPSLAKLAVNQHLTSRSRLRNAEMLLRHWELSFRWPPSHGGRPMENMAPHGQRSGNAIGRGTRVNAANSKRILSELTTVGYWRDRRRVSRLRPTSEAGVRGGSREVVTLRGTSDR